MCFSISFHLSTLMLFPQSPISPLFSFHCRFIRWSRNVDNSMQIRTHLNTLERCGHSLVSLSFIVIMMMCKMYLKLIWFLLPLNYLFMYGALHTFISSCSLQTQPTHSENQKVCRLVRFNWTEQILSFVCRRVWCFSIASLRSIGKWLSTEFHIVSIFFLNFF